MSTRSLTGRACADGFTNAVFVHSDGYPTYHGPALFALAEQFDNLHDLLAALSDPPIDAGWSSLHPGATEDPYPTMLGERGAFYPGLGRYYVNNGPHFRAAWNGHEFESYGTEWAYAIEPDARTLMVAVVTYDERGCQPVAVVRFGDAVDWAAIESGVSA